MIPSTAIKNATLSIMMLSIPIKNATLSIKTIDADVIMTYHFY
jgi:hypothetical protein